MKGRITKRNTVSVTVPIPKSWMSILEGAVISQDTDRSKFARQALKEKLQRLGVNVPTGI